MSNNPHPTHAETYQLQTPETMIPPKSKKQKQAPTLVHLAQQTIIANAQFIQDIESLTPNLYKPILQQVEVHQLRRIEENNSVKSLSVYESVRSKLIVGG